jgi:hypothetical protein
MPPSYWQSDHDDSAASGRRDSEPGLSAGPPCDLSLCGSTVPGPPGGGQCDDPAVTPRRPSHGDAVTVIAQRSRRSHCHTVTVAVVLLSTGYFKFKFKFKLTPGTASGNCRAPGGGS